MRFSLLIFIFVCSQLLAQSTIFIKYLSEDTVQESYSQMNEIFNQLNSANQISPSVEKIEINSFKKEFGNLNPDLNKTIKVTIPNNISVNNFITQLKSNSQIEYIQQASTLELDYLPTDSLYNEQWGIQSVNASQVWEIIEENSNDILLAVIDTGIDYLHPDIDGNIYINKGEYGFDSNGNDKSENGIDDDKNGFIDDYRGWDFVNKLDIFPIEPNYDFTNWDNDPMDEHGHGTNISGIIAAKHNTIGIAGLLPNVKILNLRSFDKNGEGQEDDAASAIIYAVKMGAKVINMSWGDNQYSQLLKDVIEFAYENGVVLVGSSGNSSSDEPHYPSSFSEVISVGAIQENEAFTSFSNFGSTIDLVAPGSQIYSLGLNNTYKKVSGTSVSAPFVSSAASILLSQKNFSNEEVKQILKTTAKDLGESGWDEKYGSGNLDILKAVRLLSPSEIKINFPTQDFYTSGDIIDVNITCLSPYFKEYKLYYGTGFNPDNWEEIITGNQKHQTYRETVHQIDPSELVDTAYTLRLVVNRVDGNTLEERVNFGVDRSLPKILNYNYFPAMLNDREILQASLVTNEPAKVKLHYRRNNLGQDFKFIYLDGFNGDLGNISQSHFGMLPLDEQLAGFDHEFYFEVINQAGLITNLKNGQNNFSAKNIIENRIITNKATEYNLPNGRIFPQCVKLNGDNFIFLNQNETSSYLSIYKRSTSGLEKVNQIKNRIPVSVGDFNNDGKTDILSLYVKNGYIDSHVAQGTTEFQNVFSDTSETFWPALADDIDGDGKYEIIVFSSDSIITIWEVASDFSLIEESKLKNFVISNSKEKSIFRNNKVLVGNFDEDSENEIVTFDNYGRMILYQINGNNNYKNDKIVEHFYPLESNSDFTKGDYNGDGKLDIAVLVEFEDNVFETPLIYGSVFSLVDNDIQIHFQNMFISTENSFVSSFDKQYKAISLEDVNQNGKDDLIIFSFPNSYIFEHAENPQLMFYQKDVNSQSIFLGDLDENGITEVGVPQGDKLYFQEFVEDVRISPPILTDYYSLDSNRIFIEWNNNDHPVYISRIGIDGSTSKERFISVSTTNFIDSVEPNVYYKYLLEYHDPNDSSIISSWSNVITVFSHAPGEVKEIVVNNNKKIELIFTQPVKKKEVHLNSFLIDNKLLSSVAVTSDNSYHLTFSQELSVGDHLLTINNFRDFYNSPIKDTTLTFEVMDANEEEARLFITNYEILDNYNLSITFNFNLDSLSAFNKNNYLFTPNNSLKDIYFNNKLPTRVKLTTEKPFGSIGREYVLKIENIRSTSETGSFPITRNSGSEIVLTSNAENLDDIYVYPNPVNFDNDEYLTFANLTSVVEIYIFTIDGIFVQKVVEDDGNGGVDWNLMDVNNQKVSSGIYFYKAISYDNLDRKLKEKIGKFAVIK